MRRLLGGERVPAEIVFVPRLGWKDLMILGRYLLGIPGNPKSQYIVAQGVEGYFDTTANEDLGAGWEEWIFTGEKGVWEVGTYIRAKCAVEITLDHCIIWSKTWINVSVFDVTDEEERRRKSSHEIRQKSDGY